jgi:hypothetical protein
MTKANDTAYPIETELHTCYGLTKREFFAAMAMQGMLSNPNNNADSDITAIRARKQADELIKELNK